MLHIGNITFEENTAEQKGIYVQVHRENVVAPAWEKWIIIGYFFGKNIFNFIVNNTLKTIGS